MVGGTTSGYWDDRQARGRPERADDRDEDGDDRREPRPVDEEVAEPHCPAVRRLRRGFRRPASPARPGRMRCRPLMTTRSVGVEPGADHAQRRPPGGRGRTGTAVTALSVADDVDDALRLVGADGLVRAPAAPRRGLRRRAARARTGRASARRPGSGTTARPWIVPVAGSSWLSTKSMCPGAGSPARRRAAGARGSACRASWAGRRPAARRW